MQIVISCFNCGQTMYGKAVHRNDAASADITCFKCHAIIRMQLTLIHEGVPVDTKAQRNEYCYTYDKDHNKVNT